MEQTLAEMMAEWQRDWDLDEPLRKTNPRKTGAHYTYVIIASGLGVKVGHSNAPRKRLSGLQVGSPVPLWVGHTWRDSRERSMLLERQLHAVLSWSMRHGEWFDVLGPEAVALGDLFRAGRLADARRLNELLQTRREYERQRRTLDNVWSALPGKLRGRADVLCRQRKTDLHILNDRIELEAKELGLWMHKDPETRWGRRDLEFIQRSAERPLSAPSSPDWMPTWAQWETPEHELQRAAELDSLENIR